MKKVSFSGLRVSHLSNNNANSLFQSTIQVITPVRTQLGDLGNAILDRFVSNTQKFGSQVNVQYRSKLTDPLHEINKADDNLLSEIKRTVVFMTKSRDLSQKAAAQDLEFFLEPYWDVNRRPVKTQAEDTADMLAKYHASQVLQAAALKLGVVGLFTELETVNKDLTATYLSRTSEKGNRPQSGSDLRTDAETDYTDLCGMVEQRVNFTPSPELQTLFNDMDALRRQYAPLATGDKEKPTDDTPKA